MILLLLAVITPLLGEPYIGQNYDAVWPGFDTLNPIVLNLPQGPKAFNFNPQSLPHDINQIALMPDYPIEGRAVFVMKGQDSFTLVHELFHRFQKEHFNIPSANEYPDLYNPENQALLQIEEEILQKYTQLDEDTFKQDYLLIRHYRMSLLQKESQQFEEAEENLEGLANYVAMQVTGNKEPIHTMLKGMAKDENIIDKSLKWRFYVTGALLAEMLEKENVNWKEQVKNRSMISLIAFKEDPKRLETLLAQYNFKSKSITMGKQILQVKDSIQKLQNSYTASSGFEITLKHSSSLSSGGKVDRILALDQSTKVALKESGRTEGKEWVLETKQIPYLFRTKEALSFKVESSLTIDGSEISLAEIKEPIRFKELSWDSHSSKFKSKKGGVITPYDNGFEISFQVSD